ncbi:MAG TPA: DUF4380 domain-containing protein [Polyangia bacterium]|nr:DUF4380 domain-containing protein [Polyangia bacterium]
MMSRPFKELFLLAFAALAGFAACSGGSGGATPKDGAASGSGGNNSSGGNNGTGGNQSGDSGGNQSGGSGGIMPGSGGATTTDAGDASPGRDSAGDQTNTDGGPTAPAMPVMRNGHWAFDLGDLTFEVDPMTGGRITTFALGGKNILTGPTVNMLYWGSTFWTSPESQWMQPPPIQIDSAPFTVTSTATSVSMNGPPSPLLGVSISKTFTTDGARGAVQITYKITNTMQAVVHMAPWEVTRVFPGGVTFFPTGTKMMLTKGSTLPTTAQNGITWFTYDAAQITADSKLIADGAEGWMAHAAEGWVFIKKYGDVSPAQTALNEGDTELYTNLLHTYIEMEDQGAYGDIAPGASVAWTVTWYLRPLPAGASATAGDATLIQFVRDTIR